MTPALGTKTPDAAAGRGGWRTNLVWLLAVTLGVVWLWRSQLTGESVYFGNHDRLQFGLANELINFDQTQLTGKYTTWDEIFFGGVNHAALPSVGNNFSPLKLIFPLVTRSTLYFWAGLLPFLTMLAAAWAAFVCLRAAATAPAAAVGAIIYVTGVYAQLNFSQIDTAALLLVCLPLGAWIIHFQPVRRRSFWGMVAVGLPVIYIGFAPQSAYLVGFWGLLALERSFRERRLGPLLQLLATLGVLILACLPRIVMVLGELQHQQRMIAALGENYSFAQLQSFFNVTGRELLRWLDEGIFGRYPEEAAAFGNNLNLNEGFQLYASTFATLLALTVMLRHRGRWFGVFHPSSQWLACCSWTLTLVGLVALCPPVSWLVYKLFLSAPVLHTRIVFIGLLPVAALVAAGLDAWWPCHATRSSQRSRLTGVIAGLVLTLLLAGLLRHITSLPAAEEGISARQPLRDIVAAAFDPVETFTDVPAAPRRLMASRSDARTLRLSWSPPRYPDVAFAVEMRRGDGEFVRIAEVSAPPYRIGNTARDDRYAFRVQTLAAGRKSEFSEVVEIAAHDIAGGLRENQSPLRLNSNHLRRLLASFVIFGGLLFLIRYRRLRPAAVTALAGLIAFQALGDADLRANGPQTRSFPIPFKGDNLFNAPAGSMTPPTDAEIETLHHTLSPAEWRTVFLPPPGYTGYSTPHVASFWRLRTVEGYLSGVPRGIARLPWPADEVGFRTISFAREEDLPWSLLAVLNVRQAVVIDPELYFNLPRSQPLRILQNPIPALPRVFFTGGTSGFPPSSPKRAVVNLPPNPLSNSYVDESGPIGRWSTEGKIRSTFAGNQVTIDLDPIAADRCLVLNEAYHPGWNATNGDGHTLRVFPVNSFMRGVLVPAGTSRLNLQFVPPSSAGPRWSAWIAAALLFGFVSSKQGPWGAPSPTPARRPQSRPSFARFKERPIIRRLFSQRCVGIVVTVYVVLFGVLLVSTDGVPYAIDNNESFSTLWHARSLYERGISETKGLADEVFSFAPEASPYVHTHQGNFPRIFGWFIYVFGARSIQAQIWLTTFTVGLATFLLAFAFLRRLVSPGFALCVCLVMMTNYGLLGHWHVNTYRVWYGFFFFASLRWVQGLGVEGRGWKWIAAGLLNFAAMFYGEYVFALFVGLTAAIYAIGLYWRRWRTLATAATVMAAAGVLTASVLILQLVAYMGWENLRQDITYTLTARNMAEDKSFAAEVADFYAQNKIIFWQNFRDAAPLRSVEMWWSSLLSEHLQYYSIPLCLTAALLLLGASWGAIPQPARFWLNRGSPPSSPTASARAVGFGLIALGFLALFSALFGIGGRFFLLSGWSLLGLVPLAAFTTTLLLRTRLGSWSGAKRLTIARGLVAGLMLVGFGLMIRQAPHAFDPTLETSWHEADLAAPHLVWIQVTVALAAVIAAGAVLSRTPIRLGGEAHRWVPRLAGLLVALLLAYGAVYRVFTGYIFSGYLNRQAPFLVYASDMLFGAALFIAAQSARQGIKAWRREVRTHAELHVLAAPRARFVARMVRMALLAPSLLLLSIIGLWLLRQAQYLEIIPPTRYRFLQLLSDETFHGKSLVSNTYPAPMAEMTRSWGYADSTLFSGQIELNAGGFTAPRDQKYLWFADAQSNPDYATPELGILVRQPASIREALNLRIEETVPREAPQRSPLESIGLLRRIEDDVQPFLQHRLVATDRDSFAVIEFDWDFPARLAPRAAEFRQVHGQLTLRERLALSQTGQDARRRWRIHLTRPALGENFSITETPWPNVVADDHVLATTPDSNTWRALVVADKLEFNFPTGPKFGPVHFSVNDIDQSLDVSAPSPGEKSIILTASQPHGPHTVLPTSPPGYHLKTETRDTPAGQQIRLTYRFLPQNEQPEDGTVLRFYRKGEDENWRLADEWTVLDELGVAVSTLHFRALNPDTVAEHRLRHESGDSRRYEEWLHDHLRLNPPDRQRDGLLPISIRHENGDTSVEFVLPTRGAGIAQMSIAPGTATKLGPEYLGLPFDMGTAQGPSDGPWRLASLALPPAALTAPLPFGGLRIRLRFPTDQIGRAEPLVAAGVEQAADFLYLRYLDAGHIQLGYDHWFVGGPLSDPIPVDLTVAHELEITFGSLFPHADDLAFAESTPAQVASVKKQVRVTLDGELVFAGPAEAYEVAPGNVRVGENVINGTTSGPRFTGEINLVQRFWPWEDASTGASTP